MSDQKKTLIQLTRENPVLGIIYGFCIVVSVLAGVVLRLYEERGQEFNRLIAENEKIQKEKYELGKDCEERARQATSYLIARLDSSNKQLVSLYERQIEINKKTHSISAKNSRLVKQNNTKIKELEKNEN